MQKHFITQQFWVVSELFWFTLNKIPRVMKLYIFLLFCSIGLAQAANSYAQNATVNLKMQNQTVQTVLDEIENQSEFSFFFNTKHVDLNRKVSIDAENSDIFKVLDHIFSGTNVKYSVVDKKVILSTELVLLPSVSQNKKTVSGIVKDENGEPIIGANVIEKGTANGTVTDMDGKYTLEVSSSTVVLQLSYIGYLTKEVITTNKSNITIVLKEDTLALEEIVVIGYGTMKKRDLTGSISSVKSEDIVKMATSSPIAALQGRAAGVSISMDSGAPNAGVSVQIRGIGTFNNSSPLYVVDGFPMADIGYLNPKDIETIEILKDASACAIYGSRGANGVIVITTKKGKKGE
jgi:TonB-dependent SusC/RagA subfamily outer membrane receptor